MTIDTWRSVPRQSSGNNDSTLPKNTALLPSGRTAIVTALQHLSLSRPDRVAIPEFSSHCLISCVGTYATPLPMRECIKHGEQPKSVLVYEQWGWPNTAEGLEHASSISDVCILDCVDSPDAFERHDSLLADPGNALIVSLSKCLGFPAGGIIAAADLKPAEIAVPNISVVEKDQTLFDLDTNLFKTHGQTTKPLEPLFSQTNLKTALNEEAEDRRRNLLALRNSPLSNTWSDTMNNMVESGCGAGIAPLLKNSLPEKLQHISKQLHETFGIIAPVYNFNWSLNPVETEYKPCLAFPCHGELNLPEVLPDIETLVRQAT